MRKLTPIEQASLENMKEIMEKDGIEEEVIMQQYGSMKLLLMKNFVKTDRHENGEYYWTTTDEGRAFVEKYGDFFKG